jgi:hypothetical protein
MLDAANVRRMVEDAAIMDESNTKEKHTIKGRHTEFTRVGAGLVGQLNAPW